MKILDCQKTAIFGLSADNILDCRCHDSLCHLTLMTHADDRMICQNHLSECRWHILIPIRYSLDRITWQIRLTDSHDMSARSRLCSGNALPPLTVCVTWHKVGSVTWQTIFDGAWFHQHCPQMVGFPSQHIASGHWGYPAALVRQALVQLLSRGLNRGQGCHPLS